MAVSILLWLSLRQSASLRLFCATRFRTPPSCQSIDWQCKRNGCPYYHAKHPGVHVLMVICTTQIVALERGSSWTLGQQSCRRQYRHRHHFHHPSHDRRLQHAIFRCASVCSSNIYQLVAMTFLHVGPPPRIRWPGREVGESHDGVLSGFAP